MRKKLNIPRDFREDFMGIFKNGSLFLIRFLSDFENWKTKEEIRNATKYIKS